MAAHNWTYDADQIGILKNHTLSDELLRVSVGACKLLPFTTRVEGFGKHMGETVNIPFVNRLPVPANPRLPENVKIPIDKLTWGSHALTLVEFGRGVEATNLMMILNKFDVGDILQQALMDQMEESMDNAVGSIMVDPDHVKICAIPTSATAMTFDTDGTPSTPATSNLTFAHMGILSDYMTGDIHVPPYEGDNYVMVGTRKSFRGLKDDEVIQAFHMYLRMGDLFFKGEIGMVENFRLVEINREDALSNTAGSSTVLGECVAFGRQAFARVEAEPPHLRMEGNYQADFGRRQACAWYGVLEFGAWWPYSDDGKAKVVRVTSA